MRVLWAGVTGDARARSGAGCEVSSMQDVYQFVVQTLAAKCRVDPRFITPASDIFADLGIDSAVFLDAAFAIEDEYRIEVPVSEWMDEVNVGTAAAADRFRIDNFVAAIAALVEQARA
jgi:acyl carrier protein